MSDAPNPSPRSEDELFRDLPALLFNDLHQSLLEDGSLFWVKIHARGESSPKPGPVVGILTLSAARITSLYAKWLAARRLPTDDVTESNVGRWLESVGHVISRHIADDVPFVLNGIQWEEFKGSTSDSSPDEDITIADVKRHADSRDRHYANSCAFGLLELLHREVATTIPSVPPLKQCSSVGLDLLSYLAVAIDTGDRPAIEAVLKWLKGAAKRGNKEMDWPTILREFSVTRKQIRPLLKEAKRARNKRTFWESQAETELGRRLAAADLKSSLVTMPLPTPTNLTADLIAKEWQIGPQNLLEMWNHHKNEVFESLRVPD